MIDDPSTLPERPETPIQKALRLKTAAIEAKAKPPRGGKFQRDQAAAKAGARSIPWMGRSR